MLQICRSCTLTWAGWGPARHKRPVRDDGRRHCELVILVPRRVALHLPTFGRLGTKVSSPFLQCQPAFAAYSPCTCIRPGTAATAARSRMSTGNRLPG